MQVIRLVIQRSWDDTHLVGIETLDLIHPAFALRATKLHGALLWTVMWTLDKLGEQANGSRSRQPDQGREGITWLPIARYGTQPFAEQRSDRKD